MEARGGLALRAGWPSQTLLFAAAYLAYGASRWIVSGDHSTAVEHARWIVEQEQAIGVAVEASVQQALDGTPVLWLLNHAYLAAQIVVVPSALIWLYRRDRDRYRLLRDTVLITWALALPVFGLFPVAPPRLADLGMVDTITQQTGLALDSKLTTSFYNPLAAVPSLHCGFALAVGVTLAAAARRSWSRALALAWAPTIFVAVVATGNHYVFDIAAGVAATGIGYAVARQLPRISVRPRDPPMPRVLADMSHPELNRRMASQLREDLRRRAALHRRIQVARRARKARSWWPVTSSRCSSMSRPPSSASGAPSSRGDLSGGHAAGPSAPAV